MNVQFDSQKASYYLSDSTSKLIQNFLRHGDVDLDGYPDLTFNMQYGSGQGTTSKSIIFRNSACTAQQISTYKAKFAGFNDKNCRYFDNYSVTGELAKISGLPSFLTTYFDFGEMG